MFLFFKSHSGSSHTTSWTEQKQTTKQLEMKEPCHSCWQSGACASVQCRFGSPGWSHLPRKIGRSSKLTASSLLSGSNPITQVHWHQFVDACQCMTACRIDAYNYRLSPNCLALSSSACMLRCFEFCLDLYSVIQESCSKSDTFSAGASVMCLWLMHIELTISQHESSVRGHHSAHAYS